MRRRLALLLLLAAAPARADGPAATPPAAPAVAPDEAPARSSALRATLAPPASPWSFEGDLFALGQRIGTLTLTAEPGTFRDKPCWNVVERSVREAGRARVVNELVLVLSPDLTLLRGETLQRAPGGTLLTSFAWREGALEVVEQPEGGEPRHATPAVAPDATLGLFALTRFLGAWPSDLPATLRLPVFDPRFAFGDDTGAPFPSDLADLMLTLQPPGTLYEGPWCSLPRPTLAVKAQAASGRALVVHLDPTTHTLLGVDGLLPSIFIRRKGVWTDLAQPPPWFDRVGEPPQSAFDAFVTFGRGYHLPRRDLLDAAFHWPSLRAAEIAAGAYPEDVPLEQVREDWVAEFERRSKHRTEADCDDLLIQLMVTADIRRNDDGSVTIDTLPAFGDHAYTMAPKDGRWWIVKVD